MRLNRAIVTVLLALATVAVAGCTDGEQPGQATPAPSPNASTATPVPETIGTIHSSQVRVSSLNVTHVRTTDSQAEDIAVTLENIGSTEAQNVGFSVKVKDPKTGELYFGKMTLVGTIPAHSNRTEVVTTTPHDYAFYIAVSVDVYWGEMIEFRNPAFDKIISLGAIPWG